MIAPHCHHARSFDAWHGSHGAFRESGSFRMKLWSSILRGAGICVVVIFSWSPALSEPPATPTMAVELDEPGVAASCEFWNRAVRAAHARKWEELAPFLAVEERAEWLEPFTTPGLKPTSDFVRRCTSRRRLTQTTRCWCR